MEAALCGFWSIVVLAPNSSSYASLQRAYCLTTSTLCSSRMSMATTSVVHPSCTDGKRKLGVLTDLGHATPHVLEQLAFCHALLLECNHDTTLLAQSSYPAFLKRRVGGLQGHLSNDAAAQIARSLQHNGLQYLVASHLSEQNNRPELARRAMAEALNCQGDDIVVADARLGSPWLSL